jgi:allophanate hydrolase
MTITDRVEAAFTRIAEVGRPEVWISLRSRDEVLSEARRAPAGPLRGQLVAVKDNIDVGGQVTTAGCPAFAYPADRDAPAVARLRAAGAVIVGKTNLDQFATGLVGTRSPYGAVRDARHPDLVSGGSSSGSAVAVALGLVDLALGTDTAGSGRVPAAFQGIIGVKPTRGLVSTEGVVPACRTLDCVSVFARNVADAEEALWVMADPDAGDEAHGAWAFGADRRPWPPWAPLAAPPVPVIAVPGDDVLTVLSADARNVWDAAVQRWRGLGAQIREISLEPFLEAGALLYSGAFVAERYAAVGRFVDAHADAVDPTVRSIISAAALIPAEQLVSDSQRLGDLRLSAAAQLDGVDALLLPTAPRQPTIAEVTADPVGVNAELGLFTTFVNLLDMCAVAVPAGETEKGQFGLSLLAPAFSDQVVADLARRYRGEPSNGAGASPGGIPLLVVGAHRLGQPLNHQLTVPGGRLLGVVRTAHSYRMYALPSDPPKPGLLRVSHDGVSIEGELWRVPVATLGPFLAALPRPMSLGQVTLQDGSSVVGFQVEPEGLGAAEDISTYGSWLAYLSDRT